MEDFWQTRSKTMAVGVIAILIVGVLFAYTLPLVNVSSGDSYGDSTTETMGISDIKLVLDLYNRGWIYDLARLGVILALVSAVLFPISQRDLQKLCITGGCLAGLILPIYVYSKTSEGDSLGIGLILFGLACISAAIASWVLPDSSALDGGNKSRLTSDGIAAPTWMYRRPPAGPDGLPAVDPMSIPPTLIVTPGSGAPGTNVEIIAERFPVGCAIWLKSRTDANAIPTELGIHHASDIGRAHWTYTIPDESGGGFLQFEVTDGKKAASTVFTVLKASLSNVSR